MTLIPASRQIFSASTSLGTTARAAGVSIAAPEATKSFCMSTTIIAVFVGSIASICMIYLLVSFDDFTMAPNQTKLSARLGAVLSVIRPVNFASIKVINRVNDPDLLGQIAQRRFCFYLSGNLARILGDGRRQRVARLALGGFDRRLNVADQRLNVPGRMIALQRGLDCTATLMTQNHDQACAQVRHCVFDAAQRMVVDQIPSRANYEKFASAMVEDQPFSSTRIT